MELFQAAEATGLKLLESVWSRELRPLVPIANTPGTRAKVKATTTYQTVLARDSSRCFRWKCSWLVSAETKELSIAFALLNRLPINAVRETQLVRDFLLAADAGPSNLSSDRVGDTLVEFVQQFSVSLGRRFTEAYKAMFKIQTPSKESQGRWCTLYKTAT